MTKRLQEAVFSEVVRRGYYEGYTDEQFAARQVAKLVEEIAELAQEVEQISSVNREHSLPTIWETRIRELGRIAGKFFDWGMWKTSRVVDPEQALRELADIQVVVYCMAEALSKVLGRQVDIAQLAFDKALGDVPKGVRGAQGGEDV